MKRRDDKIREGTDKLLTCKLCGAEFLFTTGEQRFYHDRGLAEPRRCPECRQKRKLTPEEVRHGYK